MLAWTNPDVAATNTIIINRADPESPSPCFFLAV